MDASGKTGRLAAACENWAVTGPPPDLDAKLEVRNPDLGQHAARKLAEVGLKTYRDLLNNYPRRHEDRRQLPSYAALPGLERATIAGTVRSRNLIRSRRGLKVMRATLANSRGETVTAVWFNQPWLEKQLFPGQRLVVTGTVKLRGSRAELVVQDFEVDDDTESLSTGRITPVYQSTQGLSQSYLRRAAWRLLEALPVIRDHLPRSLLTRYSLVSLDTALRGIHFATDEAVLGAATRRLKFDEFLFLELRVLLNRAVEADGRAMNVDTAALLDYEASLPFPLTAAQQRVIGEIVADLAKERRMARLLQGDVGSGKTAVAAAAVVATASAGLQAALMAPTEILARQHHAGLKPLLFPLGLSSELLTGSMTARERREALQRVESGAADLVVGTHALIQEGVAFRDLGLAVIDEEHRFGVEQRRRLAGRRADVLVMSATPIPRSLALTYYGDLDLSVLDELPPGRTPVTTRLVAAARRRDAYVFAWEQIREGRQVFVVTPLVEDSEALDEIVSSEGMFRDLQVLMPEGCRIGLLHGRMAQTEKDSVMDAFRNHELDLLVSTTVIEVGVDVPNASVMVIENAERFGLSQLHQLRGRVGRGAARSHCLLIAGDASRKTRARLETVVATSDGHVIAEKDLELRGPGELRGTRQSGLPDLLLGDLTTDLELIEQSRELAQLMLDADPRLDAPWAARLKLELQRRVAATAIREIV